MPVIILMQQQSINQSEEHEKSTLRLKDIYLKSIIAIKSQHFSILNTASAFHFCDSQSHSEVVAILDKPKRMSEEHQTGAIQSSGIKYPLGGSRKHTDSRI